MEKLIFQLHNRGETMKISMIAGIGKNNELGKNNKLLWRLPNDLKFFRQTTMGKPIVMGHNTFLSLPKMLPGRQHIVLCSSTSDLPDDVVPLKSTKAALAYIESLDQEVFIIGGASIYKQFIDYSNKLYLTEIDREDKEADAYFPTFNKEEWDSEILGYNCDDGIEYQHVLYRRK